MLQPEPVLQHEDKVLRHVSLLKPYKGEPPREAITKKPPEVEGQEEMLQPEPVLQHEDKVLRHGKIIQWYPIKFENYPFEDARWMQGTQLKDSLHLVNSYNDSLKVISCWEIEMMASHCSAFYRDGRFCITSEMVPSAGKGLIKLPLVTFRKAKTPSIQAFAKKFVTSAAKVVVMVDPIEAKRLAVEQMELLEAKAKFKKQRAIEAINGGSAMLDITGCLIIEGYTGKPILSQVAGYLHVLADIFDKYLPAAQP
ncbi:hypothetical protein L7F22_013706 [Adiantum nelumboides]|nr:hypothetical protein [Adiantum nelumboides]